MIDRVNQIIDLVKWTLATYAITTVLASSSIFYPLRRWIKRQSPRLQIADYPHFIECRLCLGLWVSLILVATSGGGAVEWLSAYGASYFLATQER